MKMKLPFTVMVEVDTAVYEEAYGTGLTGKALADDAADHAAQTMYGAIDGNFSRMASGFRVVSFKRPDGRDMVTE